MHKKIFLKISLLTILLLIAYGLNAGCGPSTTPTLPTIPTGGTGTPTTPGGYTGGKGIIEGKVIDYETTEALTETTVSLDSRQQATTREDGTFTLNDVPEGDRLLIAYKSGYQIIPIQVKVVANETTNITINLRKQDSSQFPIPTPTPTTPTPESGKLIVRAYFEEANEDNYVTRIMVVDEEDVYFFWQNVWYSAGLDNYRELECPDAILGHHYKITVRWNDDSEYTRGWVELDSDGQIETIYYTDLKKKKN